MKLSLRLKKISLLVRAIRASGLRFRFEWKDERNGARNTGAYRPGSHTIMISVYGLLWYWLRGHIDTPWSLLKGTFFHEYGHSLRRSVLWGWNRGDMDFVRREELIAWEIARALLNELGLSFPEKFAISCLTGYGVDNWACSINAREYADAVFSFAPLDKARIPD